MRALRPIFVALASAVLAGCASYADGYYAGERGSYRHDGTYEGGRRGYGDYWYGRAPRGARPLPLYESAYYYRVLRPMYCWTWDPWYAPGWYYGITFFPHPRWTRTWYVGRYSRPSWHFFSPWRYSWGDNWYQWYVGYDGYGADGYGRGLSRRDLERARWRGSYVEDDRHTYRNGNSTPRFGSAYNQAMWLADAIQLAADDDGGRTDRDGAAIRGRLAGRGPDGHAGGHVQRWAPAASTGTVGDVHRPRWAGGEGRDDETTQPIEPVREGHHDGRFADAPAWMPAQARSEPAPVGQAHWRLREVPSGDVRSAPRDEVRSQPRFEPQAQARFEPHAAPRDEAPRFEPPSRGYGARSERFDRGSDEQPY